MFGKPPDPPSGGEPNLLGLLTCISADRKIRPKPALVVDNWGVGKDLLQFESQPAISAVRKIRPKWTFLKLWG